jgi:hypothetical protein
MLLKDNSSSSSTESPGPVAEPGLAGDEAERLLLEVVMWEGAIPSPSSSSPRYYPRPRELPLAAIDTHR